MNLVMHLLRRTLLGCSLALILLVGQAGCQRELGFFDPSSVFGNGLDSLKGFGSVLTINDSVAVRGCVDTAFIQNSGSLTSLNIAVFDTSGRFDYVLTVFTTASAFQPGGYAASQGQSSLTFQIDTFTYVPAASGSDFNVQIISVTDSLIVGVFSGTLVSVANPAKTIRLSNGGFRAYLNRPNPCTGATVSVPAAVYSFAANGQGGCINFMLNGVYAQDAPLSSSNSVLAEVNVTTPGSYSITLGPRNGYFFSGSGTFSATGVQNITLQGTGKPARSGTDTFFLNQGTFICQLLVPVGAPVINPPCTPPANTAQFQAQNISFDSVLASTDSNSFVVRGITTGATLKLNFRDTLRPLQNTYTIVPQTAIPFVSRQVRASIQVGPTTFNATQGIIYVEQTISGLRKITFCNVSFSAVIGGQTVSGLGSARLDLP